MPRFPTIRTTLRMALMVVVAWGSVVAWQRATRQTEILAETTCPFRGPPVIRVSATLAPADTAPVRAHEEVHAEQCRTLGPWKFRWTNLSKAGRLALEAPGYCAGARARIRAGEDPARVRSRLRDDATESMKGIADSVDVMIALLRACGDVAGRR